MEDNEKKFWIDTRLSEEEMVFLNKAIISEEQRNNNGEDWKENAAGNVSRCNLIDKDNWFYETVLKKLTERMFCWDWDAYRKYVVDQEEPCLPEFELKRLWVNFQKKHEHVPIHNHIGLFSFVIFMKIPTHWEEQHVLPMRLKSDVITPKSASDFQFVWSRKDIVDTSNFKLCPEDEGRMLFFPAWLNHMVYPFYGTTESEERITISGNIILKDLKKPKEQKISVDEYEGKKKMLEILEIQVDILRKELENEKKTGENER